MKDIIKIDLSQLEEHDFIYCGLRLNSKNIKLASLLYFYKGELQECNFKYKPKFNKVLGGIYRGSTTENGSTFKNLTESKFVRTIKEQEVLLMFQASDFACKKELAAINLEKKNKNFDNLDRNLVNIKAAYQNLRFFTDQQAFIDLIIHKIKSK